MTKTIKDQLWAAFSNIDESIRKKAVSNAAKDIMRTFGDHLLEICQKENKKLWLRQVIVPNINDDKEHILKLKGFARTIRNVEKVELLPYKTIGVHKYKTLNLKYRLDGVSELSEIKLKELNEYLK